ncbi:DASH complex subunit Duo1-domain-containing protein [Phycomyces blakesleeanus]|uniref:DASH complex subunit DUO1 n=1 Tax=Phycomyces blakesleeanus TaxID=4837 RepID=A0ABR3AJA8_PHYBL
MNQDESNAKSREDSSNHALRKNNLLPSDRRATLLYRTMDHTQPPVEDPSNPPHINTQRRHEYEAIKGINRVMGQVIENFGKSSTHIKELAETVNESEQLLDRWIAVLSQTEHTKRLLEDPDWHGKEAEDQAKSRETSSPTKKRPIEKTGMNNILKMDKLSCN